MIKIRAVIIFALLPLFIGYFAASSSGHKAANNGVSNFNTGALSKTDQITLTSQGTIFTLSNTGVVKIATGHPQLIQATVLDNDFLAVDKQTNYSSLEVFSQSGALVKTLQNGNTGNIDTMNWFTDPALSANQEILAFVSDKDKGVTKLYDNALYLMNLATGKVSKIIAPIASSGGIAHPVWDPKNSDILIYDNYEYDQNFNPYSVIEEYTISTQGIVDLTTPKQNAYQGAFSPSGKQYIFLTRNSENTATMYIANITTTGLTKVKELTEGDIAYPEFSYTSNVIYYLVATGNSTYDLSMATIKNGQLVNVTPISTNAQLLANSGFLITQIKE